MNAIRCMKPAVSYP